VNGALRYAETGTTPPLAPQQTSRSAFFGAWQRLRKWPWWRPLAVAGAIIGGLVALFALLRALGPQWGALAIVCAGIAAVFGGLGTRQPGTLSAYSIFNPGFQRLAGQLSAEDIDREVRGGMAGMQQPRPRPAPHEQDRQRGANAFGGGGAGELPDDGDELLEEEEEERELQAALERSLRER
jgi:hypothetical protein